MSRTICVTLLAVVLSARGELTAEDGVCEVEECRPWGAALAAWAVGAGGRGARVLTLPARGYYVTDRADPPHYQHQPRPYSEWQPPPIPLQQQQQPAAPQQQSTLQQHTKLAPPQQQSAPQQYFAPQQQSAPNQSAPQPIQQLTSEQQPTPQQQQAPQQHQLVPQQQQPTPQAQQHQLAPQQYSALQQQSAPQQYSAPQQQLAPQQYSALQQQPTPQAPQQQLTPLPTAGGKILNRPPVNYNKDKFRPSPQYQPAAINQPPQHRPVPPTQPPVSADRVDAPQRKEVSETDLYLLAAIEKLVYRADVMEKRLRKAEEALHTLLVGREPAPEPCPHNFTRVGPSCYWWGLSPVDWQSAARGCRKLNSALVELQRPGQRRKLQAVLQAEPHLAGMDWWTGGLNPGLLWIWSGSARPVLPNGTNADSGNAGKGGATGNSGNGGATGSIQGDGRCLALVWDERKEALQYRGQDCAFRHRYICEKAEDKTKISNEIERAARRLRGGDGSRTTPLRHRDDSHTTTPLPLA